MGFQLVLSSIFREASTGIPSINLSTKQKSSSVARSHVKKKGEDGIAELWRGAGRECLALQSLYLQELGQVLENLHRRRRARPPEHFWSLSMGPGLQAEKAMLCLDSFQRGRRADHQLLQRERVYPSSGSHHAAWPISGI